MSSPSFAQSVMRDVKENCEKNMAAQNPGCAERVKGGTIT